MADGYKSAHLNDEMAQTIGYTLDGLINKAEMIYVLVIRPLDVTSERMTIGNSDPDDANKILTALLNDEQEALTFFRKKN